MILPIMDLSAKTADELQRELGQRLRANRISRSLSQNDLAKKAGVSLKTLRNLELGEGSSVDTLVRTLKALDATQAIELIAPAPTVSPIAMLKNARARQRVRHSTKRV